MAANYAEPPYAYERSEKGTLFWRELYGDRRFRPMAWLRGLQISDDGESIVGIDAFGDVYVWDAATGKERTRWRLVESEDEETVDPRSFVLHGSVVEICRDTIVPRLERYDWRSGKLLSRWEMGATEVVAFVPGAIVVQAGGTTLVRDTESGREITRLRAEDPRFATAVAMSRDRSVLAYFGWAQESFIWDMQNGAALLAWDDDASADKTALHVPRTGSVAAVSPNGDEVAVLASEGAVLRWELPSGRPRAALAWPGLDPHELRYSRDGARLAALDVPGQVTVWDRATGKLLYTGGGHWVESASFGLSFDGKWYATSGEDGTVRLWDVDACKQREPVLPPLSGIGAFKPVPDSQLLARTGGRGLHLIDTASGGRTETLRMHPSDKGSDKWVERVVFTSDGSQAISCGADSRIRLWDVASRTTLRSWLDPGGGATALALVPGKRQLVVGCSDGSVWLADLDSDKEPTSFAQRAGAIQDLEVSPDGTAVASVLARTDKVREGGGGRPLLAAVQRRVVQTHGTDRLRLVVST